MFSLLIGLFANYYICPVDVQISKDNGQTSLESPVGGVRGARSAIPVQATVVTAAREAGFSRKIRIERILNKMVSMDTAEFPQ